MRGSYRESLIPPLVVGVLLAATGCGGGQDTGVVPQSSATVRAERRAFDGAPPVMAHDDFGIVCTACHNKQGMSVPDLGFAPASPHDGTRNQYSTQRCRQCHVAVLDDGLFVANSFVGMRQDLRSGARMASNSPPTIPHMVLMRENCAACHTGPGARAEILTPHPERERCQQCHVQVLSTDLFSSAFSEGQTSPEGS